MRLAPIPPIPNLGQFTETGANMLLAHLTDDVRYCDHYRCRYLAGDLNILDNAAHEGKTFPFYQLLYMSVDIADEVVVPDVPFDSQQTRLNFVSVLEYLNTSEGKDIYRRTDMPRLMFVPQMAMVKDWFEQYMSLTIRMLDMCHRNTWIPIDHFTIGIALMYDTDPKVDLLDIVDYIAEHIEDGGPRIHLLGWSRNMDTPIRIARRFPSVVRSVDTAKPFVHAREGIQYGASIESIKDIGYPGRPSDYFTRQLSAKEAYIGDCNSKILQSLI